MKPSPFWRCAGRLLALDRPLLMGIVNVTPDSFSDGGLHAQADAAVAAAEAMARDGADILDVGGESTRPGAVAVAPEEEQRRVIPVVRRLAACLDTPVSVDTRNAGTAERALEAGAVIVNDVSAGLHDPRMAGVVERTGAGWVLMHMQGTPGTMQQAPGYGDVVGEVAAFLRARLEAAFERGVPPESIVLDPGIGFGKTTAHNLALLRAIGDLAGAGRPLLVGVSRKRMLGALTGRSVDGRLAAGLAVLCWCIERGVAVMRVHDVAASRDALRMVSALLGRDAGMPEGD